MQNNWNERSWEQNAKIEETGRARERNTDSSVSAQYEDYTPPDHSLEHEEES